MQTSEALTGLRRLTESDRLDAADIAKRNVIRAMGDKPLRREFDDFTASQYPGWVSLLIMVLCILALVAAFVPSAIRLYQIGSQTFGYSISHTTSKSAVGISTVILAETAVVLFSLALAVIQPSKSSRRLLFGSMGIASAIALVGNAQIALPGHWRNPFAYLEALAPPVLVLSVSWVLKEQLLYAVARRHANEQAYQTAVADWSAATSEPERSPRWPGSYANALRQVLMDVNGRGTGAMRRRELMAALTAEDWRALVYREMQADEWYHDPDGAVLVPGAGLDFLAQVPALNGKHHTYVTE